MDQLKNFFDNVVEELQRARTKFPENKFMIAALTEETGELANALLEYEYGNRPAIGVYHEAIQVCAVAIRIAFEGSAEFGYRFGEIDQTKNIRFFPTLDPDAESGVIWRNGIRKLAADPDGQAKLNLLEALSESTEFDRLFDRLLTAAESIRDAWKIEGPAPRLHRKEQSDLFQRWPTLYHAVKSVIDATDAFEAFESIQGPQLTKVNNSTADSPLLTFDGTNACLNCGRVLAAFSGLMSPIEADTPSGYTNARFCNMKCREQFGERKSVIDRVSGSFRPGVDDAKTPDPALDVEYYDGDAVPSTARRCRQCGRYFTGPALMDAINTFCGRECQDAFHLKTHDRQPPAVTLTPAKSVADLCTKNLCSYCNDPIDPPALYKLTFGTLDVTKEFCCSACLAAYASDIKE